VRGELSASEIRAIQHLTASAIEGLTPARVSIVDDTGRLLASGSGGSAEEVMAGELEERTLGVENRLRARVEDLLANIVGSGRARVQVSAELDMNRLTRTAETFDPNGQVVRSTQTRDIANTASGPGESGQVSVGTQLPGAGSAAASSGTSEQASTTEETTNYEISRVTETQLTEAGAIRRLSVAVVLDGTYTTDANGNAVYAPRAQAELDQITALVRSAIGFSDTRGDQVQVANLQFADRPELAPEGTAAPGLFDFTRDDLMNWAEMAVTLLIGLALILFVLRPLLKRVLAPEAQPLALPQSAEIGAMGMAGAMPGGASTGQNYGPGHQLVELEEGPSSPRVPAWMNNARSMGEAQMQTLKTVGGLVDEHPKQAALIVRDWLSNAT
jgi:flagellar M-ring protein FliF